jgi:hypothetical protein
MMNPNALATLSREASTVLQSAKQLYSILDAVPQNDPRRQELEQTIRVLLESASSISRVVQNMAAA